MAKKAELLEQAQSLSLEVSEKNTVAEIQAAIDNAETTITGDSAEPKLAKAGKRSAKAVKEAEEKEAKEERKAHSDEEVESEQKPKQAQKPARSKLERKGKKFREAAKLIEADKQYTLKDALALAIKTNPAKFDASVELHVKLGVDPRQADQNIRGTVSLPAGTGKDVRIAVFAEADDAKKALAAGATIAGSDEFLQLLDKEELNFDVLISTPLMMARLGKYARLLGPKGLMPNPKSGTVTKDVATAVKEAKAGKVEYRVDSTGIIHLSLGKTNFKPEGLEANAEAITAAIKAAKPSSIKATYVQSVFITTTMGPSIPVLTSEV